MIKLACFDMDYTLLSNDCDVSWKQFLIKSGLTADCSAEIERFAAEDSAGTLDQGKFLEFQFREFRGRTMEELDKLARRHFEEVVRPRIRRAAFAEVEKYRKSGVETAILTSTSLPIAAPVAEFFGVNYLWATEVETDGNGRFTGRPAGVYLSGINKRVKLLGKLLEFGISPEETAAYGDSVNDVAMLECSAFANAVNPSELLRIKAEENKWRILDWESAGLGL